MELWSSAFWVDFAHTLQTPQKHTSETVCSQVLEDETYCGDLKAPGLGDVQDSGFWEESPRQRGHGPDFHLPQIPRSSEDD